MKKMLIALAALALCSAALASSGPLITNAWRTGLQFVSTKKGHGSPKNSTSGFTSATTGINSSGWLYVTFKDNVGASYSGEPIQYTFTSAGAATWVCEMGGKGKGKNQAVGQQTTYFTNGNSYTNGVTLTASKRGTVSGSVVIPPPDAPASTTCSGTWGLGAVSYLLPSNSLQNTTLAYSADSAMTGTCAIGKQCSDVLISGVVAPAVQ